MTPSSEQINTWISVADTINSIIDFNSINEFILNPKLCVKKFIIDMRAEIERWDLVVNYIFIHPKLMEYLLQFLGNEVEKSLMGITLWGSKIISTCDMPPNMLLGFCDYESKDYRNIALATINIELIKRLDKIKAFW